MWIELPEAFDAVKLNKELREAKLQIAVGSLFSASGKYRNCLRLSYAQPFTEKTGKALEILGAAVERAMERCGLSIHAESSHEQEGRVSERE